jgi:hypothetical protein
VILLLLPLQCWDYRCALHLAELIFLKSLSKQQTYKIYPTVTLALLLFSPVVSLRETCWVFLSLGLHRMSVIIV